MWPTESPWLAVLICTIPAAVLASLAMQRGSGTLGTAAGACALLAAAAIVADRLVVTDREQIEEHITGVVRAFEAGDLDRTWSFFSRQAVCERALVQFAIQVVTVDEPLSLKDYQVTLHNENSMAVSTFRVNGRVNIRGQPAGYHPSLWRATWRKEAGEWRILRIQELDPIHGEPIDRLKGLGARLCP